MGYAVFGIKYTLTAGISEEYTKTTNINMQSIIDNKNTKFVETIKQIRANNKPGLGLLAHELQGGAKYMYYPSETYAGQNPLSTRIGLFDVYVGDDQWGSHGAPSSYLGFRPVIWVK